MKNSTFKILGSIQKNSKYGTEKCTLFELPNAADKRLLEILYVFSNGNKCNKYLILSRTESERFIQYLEDEEYIKDSNYKPDEITN